MYILYSKHLDGGRCWNLEANLPSWSDFYYKKLECLNLRAAVDLPLHSPTVIINITIIFQWDVIDMLEILFMETDYLEETSWRPSGILYSGTFYWWC